MIHNLSGAAGTFGYPALSAAAMAIDDVYAAGARPDPDLFAALQAELARIVNVG